MNVGDLVSWLGIENAIGIVVAESEYATNGLHLIMWNDGEVSLCEEDDLDKVNEDWKFS